MNAILQEEAISVIEHFCPHVQMTNWSGDILVETLIELDTATSLSNINLI